MKFILTISFCFLSVMCFANIDTISRPKVDSAAIRQQQIQATVQAIEFVLADMKTTLYGKLTAEDYAALIKIQNAYVDEKNKQFAPPKPPKKQ